MSDRLTCRQLIEFLLAYVEDELEAGQREVFDRHLGACPPCRHYLDSYRATVALGRQAYTCHGNELPPEVPESLVAAVLAARQQGRGQGRSP